MAKKTLKHTVKKTTVKEKDRKAALIAKYRPEDQKTEEKKPAKTTAGTFSRLLKEAKEGNPESMRKVALAYRAAYLKDNDEEKRKLYIDWLKQAAEAGSPAAQFHLSVRYGQGDYIEKDGEQTVYWMTRCAEKWHLKGGFWAGKYYSQGSPVPRDIIKAEKYFTQCIQEEPADEEEKILRAWAKFELALLYFQNNQFSAGRETIIRLLEESKEEGYTGTDHLLDTVRGSTGGMLQKANSFFNRHYWKIIKSTIPKAPWLLLQKDESKQMNALMDGVFNGVFNDDELIKELREEFMPEEKMYPDQSVVHYTSGPEKQPFVPQHAAGNRSGTIDSEALLQFVQAPSSQEMGDKAPLLYTMKAVLGKMNDSVSTEEYTDLMKKAADLGEGFACFTLGVAYMTGDGVQADQEQAVHYLQIAAEQGIPDANAFLAHEYYFGLGIKGDTRKAIQLLSSGHEYYIAEETCKKIRTDLLALNRGRKKPNTVYPFWFMQKNEPVITKAILSKALRSYIQEEVDRATDDRMSEVLLHLQRLETITMDTNIRTRDIQTDLSRVYQYLTVDLSRMLKEEKNLLSNHLDQEEQLNRFFDRITKYINENVLTADDLVSEQTHVLAHTFGDLWERMLPESRSSLISAAVLMKTCKDIQDESFDFSGVCISATSALEGELKRIFYTGLISWMTVNGTSQEDINYVNRRITKSNVFTLGSMPFALAQSDKQNETEKQRIKAQLIPYLHTMIPGCEENGLLDLFSAGEDSLLSRIDYVREKYRNSAAHSDNLDRLTAEDCCRDVIGSPDHPGLLADILKLF